MSNTLVIIPTFNEKENIEAIIKAVFSQEKEFPNLFIENRKEKTGLGTAYIHGFKWALKKGYDYIIEMDADFSHNPKDLIRLYKACAEDGADFSIGSRYLNNKINVVNWDIKRLILSYFASKYVKIITRIPIFDTTAGFVCYHRSVLEAIKLDKIQFVGYAFQIEMKFKAWKRKFKHKEVSVIFTDRKQGTSKMSGSIISEAVFGVLKMRLNGLPD